MSSVSSIQYWLGLPDETRQPWSIGQGFIKWFLAHNTVQSILGVEFRYLPFQGLESLQSKLDASRRFDAEQVNTIIRVLTNICGRHDYISLECAWIIQQQINYHFEQLRIYQPSINAEAQAYERAQQAQETRAAQEASQSARNTFFGRYQRGSLSGAEGDPNPRRGAPRGQGQQWGAPRGQGQQWGAPRGQGQQWGAPRGPEPEPDPRGLYRTLGLTHEADSNDIKKEFRKLALKYHPDKYDGDDTQFKKIAEAYEILSDPRRKTLYDTGQDDTVQDDTEQSGGKKKRKSKRKSKTKRKSKRKSKKRKKRIQSKRKSK